MGFSSNGGSVTLTPCTLTVLCPCSGRCENGKSLSSFSKYFSLFARLPRSSQIESDS